MPTSISAPQKQKQLSLPLPAKPSLLGRFLPYLVWQVIAIFTIEATLAMAGLGEEELFKLDPQIGTVHMVNKSITWRKEGYARSYLHSNGLREAGITEAKPAGVYRIILLGDSQVEGVQVALKDTAGQLLENRLTTELGRPVQVLNFGVSGYSTVQEYLLMKREVFKYSPDMVLMGYDSRDMFENWSAPDSAISNVRPYALKLPGQKLVVDSSSVTAWMKSPRGKFLNSIEWLRANSRIWGLISAYETEASSHNEVYKAVINFFISPVKTFKQFSKEAAQPQYWTTVADQVGKAIIQTIKAQIQKQMPGWETSKAPLSDNQTETTPATASATQSAKASNNSTKALQAEQKDEAKYIEDEKLKKSGKIFISVITNTMEALLQEFKKETDSRGCKFVVYALPSRATLAPIAGMDAPMLGMNHEDEVEVVQKQCQISNIPFIDSQKEATTYSNDQLGQLFYTAHLNQAGQKYVADQLDRPLAELIRQSK